MNLLILEVKLLFFEDDHISFDKVEFPIVDLHLFYFENTLLSFIDHLFGYEVVSLYLIHFVIQFQDHDVIN
jgi:hypothetical protein